MKYVIIPNHPQPNHTEDATGTPCRVLRVPDSTHVEGPGVVVASLDGYTPIDGFTFDKPAPVPHEIASWRAKAVLKLAGLITEVEAQLAIMPGTEGTVARTAWEAGSPLLRNGATVRLLAAKLGLTDAQVDDMFRQAAALQV